MYEELTIRRYLNVALLNLILAIAACVVFQIPSGWYICCLDFAMVTWAFAPFWFCREPGSAAQDLSGSARSGQSGAGDERLIKGDFLQAEPREAVFKHGRSLRTYRLQMADDVTGSPVAADCFPACVIHR